MEKIFAINEVPKEKRVDILVFYLSVEADIWWSIAKDKLVGTSLNSLGVSFLKS